MVSFSRALVLALASAFTLLSTSYSQITPVYNSRNYLIEVTDAPAYAELPNAVNITGGDDRVDYIPLPFNFVFYNRSYASVNASSNGNIQFRTAATGYSNALFGQGSNLYAPVIAAFFADLYPTTAGQRVWAVTGTTPNRQFIIRWRDVNYCCTVYTPGSGLLMDVILSEGTNNVDIRYYRVLSGTRNVEIGVQNSGDNSQWAYIWNDVPMTADNVTLLQGKNVRFVPQNQAPGGSPPEPLSITPIYNSREYEVVVSDAPPRANIPDMTSLRAVTSGIDYIPLGFNFVFYNRSYNSVNVSTHGNVQFRTAATSYGNMLFGPTGTNSYSPVIAAFFAYLYPNTLGQRTYAVTGTAPNRQFILRWNDVQYGANTGFTGTGLDMDVILTETSNTIDVRYYRIPISWSVARNVEIGVQNSGSGNAQWVSVWNDMPFYEEAVAGFTGKNIRYNPVNQDPNGTPPQPIAITPVYNSRSYVVAVTTAPARPAFEGMTAFPAADDACSTVQLGFSFVFYNQTYSSACVSTNGNMQFMTTATGYSNSLFGQTATGSTAFTPIIAAFFTDLYPTNAAQRSYITRGTAPNREFIARFTDVNYCCVAYAPGVGLNMDIVLYETTNNIDIRYYQLPLGTRNVEMGVENRGGSDWVYIWNDEPIVEEVALGWLNKNVRYTPQNQGQGTPVQPDAPITITPVYGTRKYTVAVSDAPARMEMPNMTNLTARDDGVDAATPIGFNFHFYNRSFSTVGVSTNGNLQFMTTATGYSNSLFGTSTTANAYSPVIAAFFVDLYPTTLGQRTYSTTGTAPDRQFIVRYTDVNYCCTAVQPGVGLSMDIILYETLDVVEIRYYRIPISATTVRRVEIGLQNAGDLNDWVYVWNDEPFNTTSVAAFTNKAIRFTAQNMVPGAPDPDPSDPGAPVTITPVYNTRSYVIEVSEVATQPELPGATNITGVDDGVFNLAIPFTFVFYNRTYTSVGVSSNGNLQFATAATGYSNSLFGQGSTGNAFSPVLAFFFADLYPRADNQRVWAVTGTAPNRELVIRFVDVWYCCQAWQAGVGLSMDIILYETSNNIDTRYYRIPISTTTTRNVEIGVQNSGNNNADWAYVWNDTPFNAASVAAFTNKQIRYIPQNQPAGGIPIPPLTIAPYYNRPSYTATIGQAPALAPIAGLTNLTAADDAVHYIPLGFTFIFYNRSYTQVGVSTNGNLQWATSRTGFSNSLFGQGTVSDEYTPIIAAFFADLYPTTAGQRTYILTDTAPNRRMVIRFTDVGFCCTVQQPGSGLGASFDIILYETTNIIEINYHRVPLSGTRNLEIGIQNYGQDDWAYIWNDAPINAEASATFTGKQVRWTPVGQSSTAPPGTIVPVYGSASYLAAVSDAPTRATITTGMTNITGSDDGVTPIPIGFEFVFYNRSYTTVNVGANGNLQFATTGTGYSNSLFGQDGTAANLITPIVAAFFADMYPRADHQRQYRVTGTAPNRQLMIRWTDVWYCCQAWQPNVGLNMDIILYEGSNNIDLRWYRIPVSTTTVRRVEIGLQNTGMNGGDWVYVWNDEAFTDSSSGMLTNKQVRFAPQNQASVPVPPIQITPVYSTRSYVVVVSDAPALAALAGAVNIAGADDRVDMVTIPFPFTFYNRSYESVGVSTNGNLQFVTASTGYSNSLFGQGTAANSYTPIIAAYFVDLYPTQDHQRSYATIGTTPNRQFIVRYTDVNYCCTAGVAGVGLTMDVILTETSNTVDIRYYQMLASGSRNVEIGLQNMGGDSDWVYLWNDEVFSPAAVTAFTGKNIRFNPQNQQNGGIPIPPITITPVVNSPSYTVAVQDAPARGTYTGMTNITGSDDTVATDIPIGFSFVFYNQSYTTLNSAPNGNIQFLTSSSTFSNSLFGQGAAPSHTPIIAFFFTDLYPTQDYQRTYITTGTAPNRQFILRYTDVNYCCTAGVPGVGLNADIVLFEGTNVIETRYYRILAGTRNIEIGIQNEGASGDWAYVWDDTPFNAQAVTAFTNKVIRYTPVNQGQGQPLVIQPVYAGASAYRVDITQAPSRPAALPGTTVNLRAADDFVDAVPIGFTFNFYGVPYTQVGVSTNGNLQFATNSTGYSNSLFNPGAASTGFAPIVAAFFGDLYPTTEGQRTYSVSGTAPNRQLNIRFNDVWFCCTPYEAGRGLQMDIILTETTNTVDIRYYRIAVATNSIEIGIQNVGIDQYAYVWNDQAFTQRWIDVFQGKQIRFAPPNVPAPSTSVPTGPVNPTAQPTVQPTAQPTAQPTGQPTAQPTTQPTGQPQPSSTGAQVSPVKIKFSFNMPQGANVENVKNALLNDIASTIVRRIGGQQSIIRGYLSMDVASTPSRRLLQNTQTMYATLTMDGNLRSTGMSGDVYSAADAVSGAISEGALVTDSAQANGVTVPRQTPNVEGGRAQSSSSSSLSGGAIAGIVIGVIVGVLVLAVFCFFALAGYRRGDKYTGHTDVEPSRVSGGADHGSHHDEQEQGEGEVEMETV